MGRLTLFVFLLFAHLVGDVLVRPDIVKKYKHKSILVMVFHCFTYSGVVISLYMFYRFIPGISLPFYRYLDIFIFVFLSHLMIDVTSSIINPVKD